MTVVCKPLCGIRKHHKHLPIRFMPITIDLSLPDVKRDPCLSDPSFNIAPRALYDSTNAHTSYVWSVLNAQANYDLITLVRSMRESSVTLLEEGNK